MNFQEIDRLKAELDRLRPLPPDAMRKLTEKLRLDWNYHSNAIEGNTLTYGETKALLLHDRYIGNKEGRHYREIRAHDDVIQNLSDLVKEEEYPLTEKLIKELHAQMLGEPYYTPALTPDGHDTQKRVIPGQYKTQPNSVRRSTGDMFFYAEPVEVPGRMGDLLEEYREQNVDPAIHPIQLAAWFHYVFIRIHPFDDGNGRLARILMNLILMRRGYAPAIVKVENKAEYLDALQLVDATDDLEPFVQVIARNLQWVMELEVKAAKGESLDEPGDLRKKIKLINSQLPDVRSARPHKDWELVLLIWKQQILPFCKYFDSHLEAFSEIVSTYGATYTAIFYDRPDLLAMSANHLERVFEENKPAWQNWGNLFIEIELSTLNRKGGERFIFRRSLRITFEDYEVLFFPSFEELEFSIAYDERLSTEELKQKAESWFLWQANDLSDEIKFHYKG